MTASQYISQTQEDLQDYYKNRNTLVKVEKEWSVSKNSSDAFKKDKKSYRPRLDLAIGPFNNKGDEADWVDIPSSYSSLAPKKLKMLMQEKNLTQNWNPRCMIAIEVIWSAYSSKHVLGDITNASMMGLYGIIIVKSNKQIIDKVDRIYDYINLVKLLHKAPEHMFGNILITTPEKFKRLFQ